MASADYRTALKNGIDAARSGSRMMARLHLLKAADFAPDEVACHLWLAWVAETPADALTHLEDALARNPRHSLARVGRLWTRLMAEFDAGHDSADVDVGELAESSASGAAPTASPTSAPTMRLSATQRLSDLPGNEKKTPTAAAEPEKQPPLDLTRTVRMDLVQRERPGDMDDLAQTCLFPPSTANPPTDAPQPPSEASSPPDAPTGLDEPIGSATIRLDRQAVKRALAETVIAEMTSPERSTHSAVAGDAPSAAAREVASIAAAAEGIDASAAESAAGCSDAAQSALKLAARVDEYTEPPNIALSPDAVQTPPPVASPANGPRVLVVDDSPTVRKLVASTLESRGYRVVGVASGYEAVEVLSQTTPDALVIEVDLPRLDGLHLCKLLRTQEATRATPVIILTRRSGTMDRMRGKMVGATAYLTKPFRSAALLEELESCCPGAAN
ncbi:MAG: response regulator [Pirellulales bacterium]